jgi:ring-1,2-phenylacetyl-CoA epoxidase subunit PaaE
MAQFYSLKIKNIRRETADCVSIAFDVPPQYADVFRFKQGQYLTLKTHINGAEVRRSYSICTAPCDGELRIAVKEVFEGAFSKYANRVLKEGDVLEAMPPMGHFYANDTDNQDTQVRGTLKVPRTYTPQKHYVFFAAGSGITPVISNIKTILKDPPLPEESGCPHSICTLIYGNRHVSSIIFKEEIEALKNQYLGRFQVFNVLSRERTESELLFGRLDAAKIALFFDKIPNLKNADEFFSCGPIEMTEAVRDILTKQGVSEKNIHFELFNAPKIKANQPPIKGATDSITTIKIDGLTMDIPIKKGQTILDAAQEIGADLPFACKGGVCCTCRAKLIEGDVDMAVNYALTKEETAAGFILTCQAVPKTKRVVVDFDIK